MWDDTLRKLHNSWEDIPIESTFDYSFLVVKVDYICH